MANISVSTTNVTIASAIGGARSIMLQNLGSGNLYFDVTTDANATVTVNTGILVSANSTMPVDLYQAHLRGISNGTADVRFTG